MVRITGLAVALLLACAAARSYGQETDELKRLQKEIELLQAKLDAANLKIEKLQQENKQLQADAAGKPAEKAAAKDPFAKGAVFTGFRLSDSGKKQNVELAVTKRDGTSFEGQLTITRDDRETRRVVKVFGTATSGNGGLVRFKTEKSGKFEQAFSGKYNSGSFGFDFAGTDWLGEASKGSGEIKAK
jgi:hypothetical protein